MNFIPLLPRPFTTVPVQPSLVLDSSIVLGWHFSRELQYAFCHEVLFDMRRTTGCVPVHWVVDVITELDKGVKKNQTTLDRVNRFLPIVQCLRIEVDAETPIRAWNETQTLARKYSISPSKAAYLELALRLKLPLASVDAKLLRVAGKSGVELFAV